MDEDGKACLASAAVEPARELAQGAAKPRYPSNAVGLAEPFAS